jgi:phage shock protein A
MTLWHQIRELLIGDVRVLRSKPLPVLIRTLDAAVAELKRKAASAIATERLIERELERGRMSVAWKRWLQQQLAEARRRSAGLRDAAYILEVRLREAKCRERLRQSAAPNAEGISTNTERLLVEDEPN